MGGARCSLNRSSTTSAPPSRNYESLREGSHRVARRTDRAFVTGATCRRVRRLLAGRRGTGLACVHPRGWTIHAR